MHVGKLCMCHVLSALGAHSCNTSHGNRFVMAVLGIEQFNCKSCFWDHLVTTAVLSIEH